ADLAAELLCGSALGGRKLAPQQVGDPAVHVTQAAIDGQLDSALRLGGLGGGYAVGARDDHKVRVTEIVGGGAHHLELAHELIGGDERFPRDVAAALRHYLVLYMGGRDAGSHIEVGRALDVEQ